MRFSVFLFFLMGALFCSEAATKYRDFMDTKGRTIRGRVMKYDPIREVVTIELANKRISKAPLDIFSDEDRSYIEEWNLAKDFLSESTFKIDAKRKKSDNKNGRESGFVLNTDAENVAYAIELNSRSASTIKNLTVEYCIYYEQEEHRGTKQGVRCDSIDIGLLKPKSSVEKMTKSVTIYKKELSANAYYIDGAKNVQRGDVHGIWIKISMELPSGEKAEREFCLPDSLSKKKEWTTKTVSVGMN